MIDHRIRLGLLGLALIALPLGLLDFGRLSLPGAAADSPSVRYLDYGALG